MKRNRFLLLLMVIMSTASRQHASADEGMWVFNNLPLKQLKEAHGFEPTPEWTEQLRASAVRFNNGGSGSFVSRDGLIMTNHHVAADTLAKLGTSDKDYYRDGFLATSHEAELPAPDLELNGLRNIEDVTERVQSAVKPGMDDAAAAAARRAAMAVIEQEATEKNGLRNDVVTLYQGGQYHLYTYKKYTDVRLVFAPEFEAAFFGGDEDNFEYPRYCLDVAFFRAYEDGKPARVEHFLSWSPDGASEGDLIFVAGHPGRTSRLNTVASLEYLRDTSFPWLLDYLRDKEAFLLAYGQGDEERYRQAKDDLFGIQNSRKARTGGLGGLRDEAFMTRKREAEQTLRARIAGDPDKQKAYGAAWDRIAEAQKVAARILKPSNYLERGLAFDSELFTIARTLVRMAEELPKPNEDRLREYRDSNLESLKLRLFSEAPIYPEFEKAKLAHSLKDWSQAMPDHPLVESVVGDLSAEDLAESLVEGSRLADVAVRKQLAEGGQQAIEASDDPMIQLAREIDAEARSFRKIREDQIEGVEEPAYALIARALFETQGDSVYPDATFTLRLAFGTVKGYRVDEREYPPFTDFAGAFEHEKARGAEPPFRLPSSWHKARDDGRLDLATPINTVSTADIIGGNSGSPVVDRRNRVVGLIFDGNIQSLVLDFGYDDKIARAISVDSRGILEALRSIYRAKKLVDELTENSPE